MVNEPGVSFATDLKLIREARGVTIDEIHALTKVPQATIARFERSSLSHSTTFNKVYLTSLGKQYASLVDINPEDAVGALELDLLDAYDGRLAKKYLGVEPVRPSARHVEPNLVPIDVVEKTVERRKESSPNWMAGKIPLILGAAGLLLAVLIGGWLLSRGGVETTTETEAVSTTVAEATIPAESEPEPPSIAITAPTKPKPTWMGLLGRDSLRLDIIAARGRLEPVRVQVDDNQSRRHWVERNDTLTFRAAREFLITGLTEPSAEYLLNGLRLQLDRIRPNAERKISLSDTVRFVDPIESIVQ